MAWYYGKYSCGHEGRVNIIGPVKDREWKKEREFRKMCPECWKKHLEEERRKENEKAKQLAEEMELPALTGTPKQVDWANTLRQELIEKFDKVLEWEGVSKEDIIVIRDYILENKTSSAYYIDNRNMPIVVIIEKEMKDALKSDEEKYMEELVEKEKVENTVYPKNNITDSVVEFELNKNEISLVFKKDYQFIGIVKDLGYTWNGSVWHRVLDETTGSYKDRAAEAGNRLLSEGYPVMIPDKTIREMAINGEFEKEHTRWITVITEGKYKGWFSIKWKGFDDSLYKVARSLPRSKWQYSSVIVDSNFYNEVEEFAELYNFKFCNEAKDFITELKETKKEIEVVSPVKQTHKNVEKDGLKAILESNSDILEHLKDD